MKKILLIILIMLLSTPVFAVPGYEEAMQKVGGKAQYCDVSEMQAYAAKLKDNFFKKYSSIGFTGEDYDREVTVPILDFMAKEQHEGHCGYEKL